MLKKDTYPASVEKSAAIVDAEFKKQWPTLFEYLTQSRWEDGSARELSTLGIYPEAGIVRALFRDPGRGIMFWVAVTRLSDLWAAVEAALSDPGTDWRHDRRKQGEQASVVKHEKVSGNGVAGRKRRP